MTTAQDIAALYGNDGQRFTASDGSELVDTLDCHGKHDSQWGNDRWTFDDGSAIVIHGDAWDLVKDPDDPSCHCFAGLQDHATDCPAR